MLCVARSLCVVEDGLAITEACNSLTEEFWIRRGTVVASASVILGSAFKQIGLSASPTDSKPEKSETPAKTDSLDEQKALSVTGRFPRYKSR
jgi:hypothetical protein